MNAADYIGIAPMPNPRSDLVDMLGQRIGKLTVIARLATNKYNQAAWLCRCDCGTEVVRTGSDLRKAGRINSTVSCKSCHMQAQWRNRQYFPPADKRCTGCGNTKPASEFSPRKDGACHLQSRCKTCRSKVIGPKSGRVPCLECCGMAHRRPKEGCWRCGGEYRTEPAVQLDTDGRRER